MQISFNVFLPLPLCPPPSSPAIILSSCILSGVSFYMSLVFLLLFFGKLRFHLNAARQKSLSAFLPKKLADAFYDTFIRFRLSVDVAGFVSSTSAAAVDVVDGFCSVLGSACWFFLFLGLVS